MSAVDITRPGVWTELFPHALTLMAHLEGVSKHCRWTFGGGTVLMLRIDHRQSKDIDLFVPDPQYLPYVSPRLSDVAEQITDDYVETAGFVKLNLPQGEIDIVVGASLTPNPYDVVSFHGRDVRVETCAEILAKKFHHRGDKARVRDLFDLCAIALLEPSAIEVAAPFMRRHGKAFLDAIRDNAGAQEKQFDEIETISFASTYAECVATAERIISPLLADAELRPEPQPVPARRVRR